MIRFMNSITPFLLLCLVILLLPRIIKGQQYCSGPTYAPNSTYHTNLIRLLSSLSSNAIQSNGLFYNTTVGQNSDNTVYGLFLCRGDVTIAACDKCVSAAVKYITTPQRCPNTTQAVGWYNYECMIRFSDKYIFSVEDDNPLGIFYNAANATDQSGFMELALDTLKALAKQSAYGGGGKKFATREVNYSNFQTIYSLVQCTPDLSADDCYNCLRRTIAEYPNCCFGALGGVVLAASCTVRYELYPFYRVTLPSPPSSLPLPPSPPSSPPPPLPPESPSNDVCHKNPNAQAYQVHCSGPTHDDVPYGVDAYSTNLITLLSTLSSNSNRSDGFYNATVGQNTNDTFYGLYLCRGDTTVSACQECLSIATMVIMKCRSTTQAVAWLDKCMKRYSDKNFFSIEQDDPTHVMHNNANATNQASFMRLVIDTMNEVAREAAYRGGGNGSRKFATREEKYSSFETLYTLAQCTPDLSGDECYKCLRRTIGEYPNCCFGRVGAKARTYSCNVRYDLCPFYGVVSPMPSNHRPEPLFTSNGKHNDHSRTIKIAVSVTTFVSIMLFCFGFYYWKRKKSKSYKAILKKNFGSEGATLESLQFNLATIEAATNKFGIENRLGKGGFGEVYMGILPDGRKIAVKRLSENSNQGLLEFKNEVLLIAKLQHRNLVELQGFCLKNQEKILIYEYVTNKSLDYLLFGSQKQRVLNWPERYKIIGGIARGILYLHEHSRLKVIHRDLKPSNILLDDEMNPKISDFGLARMVGINETRGSTNRIVGTLGYMSPEYIKFGLFSEKSDVFSFGVMVLEIVNGKKNTNSHFESQESQDADGLLSHAWKHWRDEKLRAMLDSNLTEAGTSQSEIIKCIHIGLLCVQGNPEVRPSASEVVQYLSNDSMQLPIPQEPAFFLHSQMEPPATTRTMESQLANHNQYSINEMSTSTLFPR